MQYNNYNEYKEAAGKALAVHKTSFMTTSWSSTVAIKYGEVDLGAEMG